MRFEAFYFIKERSLVIGHFKFSLIVATDKSFSIGF